MSGSPDVSITSDRVHGRATAQASLDRTTKLMDLPDAALSRIIASLSEPHGIRRRSVVHGPPAFPLALTCTRLLRIFKAKSLQHIDALFPETYDAVQTRAVDGQVHDRMLASMIRLAGCNLRSFHFPRDTMSINLALDELASHRVRLHELSYGEFFEPVDEDKELAVFQHMGDLRKLRVFDPKGVLRFMHLAPCLEELELTGIRQNALRNLLGALKMVGPTLRNLRVGFRTELPPARASRNSSDTMAILSCLTNFAEYISSCLAKDLPRLEILDISGERCFTIRHPSLFDGQNRAIAPVAVELSECIRATRERNVLSNSSPNLKSLIVRATFGDVDPTAFDCISLFRSVIAPNVDVEVQAVGMTVVFPADNSLPYFKSLQITIRDLQILPECADIDCTQVETVDIGTNLLLISSAMDELIHDGIMNLVGSLRDELSKLDVQIEIDSPSTMQDVCGHITAILDTSPDVDTLAFRTGVVDFCYNNEPHFPRLLDSLSNICFLRLTSDPIYSADRCKLAFVQNLPFFLESIAVACPNLKCLFLEGSKPVQPASIATPEVRKVALESYDDCMIALRAFEKNLPLCDVTSVRSQLTVWYRCLDPMNWPVLFPSQPLGIYVSAVEG